MKRLRFRGAEYILVNENDNDVEGAIATIAEYESFALNQFHLEPNGDIMSFHQVVGHRSEIEWLTPDYEETGDGLGCVRCSKR